MLYEVITNDIEIRQVASCKMQDLRPNMVSPADGIKVQVFMRDKRQEQGRKAASGDIQRLWKVFMAQALFRNNFV